jgi:phosphoglycolate phosphatase-like HAD superfamily hydrolase
MEPRKAFMHVVLFDIDGTLISSGGAGKAALERAMAAEFGVAQPVEKLQLSGRPDRAIIQDLFGMHGVEYTPHNLQRLTASYLSHLPDCLASHNGRVLPGVSALLEELRRREVLLGLLTGNIRAGARAKLGFFGLYEHFAFGGFGDHHLDRDDIAREALAEVKARLNGRHSPERIWVVGDTPLDVRCARAIEARAVAVATGWHDMEELAAHQPDLLMADLSDATALLERFS